MLVILRDNCTGCGACATACPANALEALGRLCSINDLVVELVKDRVYFEKSGGGVTLSGGEPGAQPGFASGLLLELRREGIHTALDTCGLMNTGVLTQLLSLTDQVLFDVKTINEAKHQQFTGQSNRLILSNLLVTGDYIRANAGKPLLWIRTPLIPGATAVDDNILEIGHFLAENLKDCITRWELCAFNNLCRDKYTRLDLEWPYATAPLFSQNELDQYEKIARSCGLDPRLVIVTGAVRVDDYEMKG